MPKQKRKRPAQGQQKHAHKPHNDAHGEGPQNHDRESKSEAVEQLSPHNPALIRRLRKEYELTRKQAIRAIAKGMGYSTVEAYRLAGGSAQRGTNSEYATASGCLSQPNVEDAADSVFEQHHRAMQEAGEELDEQRILNDLELLAKKGIENKQLGPAVRAKELQGRAIGVRFTEHKVSQIQELSDSDLVKLLAQESPALADMMRQELAIDAEYSVVSDGESNKNADKSDI